MIVLFVAWTVVNAILHSSGLFGFGWIISFTMAVSLPLIVSGASSEAKALRTAWLWTAAALGAYAMLELALGFNLVFGTLYDAVGIDTSQHWSVYRAEASFGHPLFAGLFLAVGAALGIVTWLESGKPSHLLSGVIAAGGVVSTLSRGSLAAMIIGIAAGAAFVAASRGHRRLGRYLILGAAAAAASFLVGTVDAFNERSNSVEASRSADARGTALDVAIQAAGSTNYLGSGPATSGETARQFGSVVIENSYLQVLISLGLPGLLLLAAMISGVLWAAVRAANYAGAAALVTVVVALAGFNALDAVRSTHLLLGLVLLLAVHLPALARQRVQPYERTERRSLRAPVSFNLPTSDLADDRNNPRDRQSANPIRMDADH
ncbi:O-antigen ligase family protein [Modestobacter sp. SYSU DS0511]